MMDDDDETEDSSHELEGSQELNNEAQPTVSNDQLSREELEEALEETNINIEEDRRQWEDEKIKLEEEISKQAKLLAALEKENQTLKQNKQNWTTSLGTIFNSKPKLPAAPVPMITQSLQTLSMIYWHKSRNYPCKELQQ